MINNIDSFMNSLFYSCPDLTTFQTLKFASDETNTEYFTYNSTTIIFGTPDVKWDQICFVFDAQYPLIYTKGKIIYDFNNIIQSINNKIGDLGNKIEAQEAIYYTQEEANAYNTTYGLQQGDSSYVTTQTIKTPAVEAVPYNNIVEIIIDNEKIISGALNEFDDRLNVIGTLGNKTEAQAAVLYVDEEEYNAAKGTELTAEQFAELSDSEKTKTPATDAVPYTSVAEVLSDLNTRINVLTAGGISNVVIGSTQLTVSNNTATITKSDLQTELFDNTYASSPLSYSYLGVTVSAKESNGELTEIKVDPSELVSRISSVEDFDPWEEYQAPAEPGE